MTKAHRLKDRKTLTKKSSLPINFLLGCSEMSLDNYELARLSDVADDRKRLLAVLDQMVEHMALAWLAAWFRTMDRNALRHAIENEESPTQWAERMVRDGQRSEEELSVREPSAVGVAHLAAALRYQERNIAEGKCSVCPEPLDRNSVRYCTKHLAMARDRDRKKKGLRSDPGSREYLYSGEVTESTHGRQPGSLVQLAMNREQATRGLLAELGVKPESAAVSLKAAKEALLNCVPERGHSITQAELFEKAGVITKTIGRRALAQLLSAKQVQRVGKGGMREPYRYYRF